MSPAAVPTSESFEQLFIDEHHRLDEILSDVGFLSGHGSFVQAAKRFGEFRRIYEKHVAAEERVLFPLFYGCTTDPSRIVGRLRDEHEGIGRLVDETAASISRWDLDGFGHAVAQLEAALKEHDESESRVLHPALDSVIRNAADWRRLCGQVGVDA